MADQNRYPKKNFPGFLQDRPLYLVLLPIFFVLHEFTANYDVVPALDSFLLCLFYIAVSCLITTLAWLYFRDLHKAALAAMLIMSYYFFYGSVRDLVRENLGNIFLLRYHFIIPFSILLIAAALIWLKKRRRQLTRLSVYLSALLVILVIYDGVVLSAKAISKKSPPFAHVSKVLSPCDTCNKPDIYLIVPDGYPGNDALQALFNISNASFHDELMRKGFHISSHSKSNYNSTLFSIASMLNMDFVSYDKHDKRYLKPTYAYTLIHDNVVTKYLTENGYRFYNFSLLDVEKQPATEYSFFIPTGTKIITSQTFFSRLEIDYHGSILLGKFGKALQKRYAYESAYYNDNILGLAKSAATQKDNSPKFIYTHLVMPHYPLYFDSKGKLAPLEKLVDHHKETDKDFFEYLQYTNKRILELVDHILASSAKPPVIMILSDHGFNHPSLKAGFDPLYRYSNQNAVYLPGGNYSGFYDNISNVNQFRVLFNTLFHQQIPLTKDTMINLVEKPEATKRP